MLTGSRLIRSIPKPLREAFQAELQSQDATDLADELALASSILSDRCAKLDMAAEQRLLEAVGQVVTLAERLKRLDRADERARNHALLADRVAALRERLEDARRNAARLVEIGEWADRVVSYRAQALRRIEASRRYVTTEELVRILGMLVKSVTERLPTEYVPIVYEATYELLPGETRAMIAGDEQDARHLDS